MNQQNNATQNAAAEVELLARAQQGEERAFEALFNAYRRRVYSLCLRMSGCGAEAEDLTQEAFLKVFRKISTFRGESTFSTWLHRIVINAVLMYLRKKRFEQVPLDEAGSWQRGADQGSLRPHRSAEQRIDRIALDEAIANLPPHHRAVFVLHDVEEREHREIAQMVNCSVARSRSLLHEARLRLRKRLRDERLARLAPQSLGTMC
jgi:RNA polymerase sigma-70 factor, ECF subfamily